MKGMIFLSLILLVGVARAQGEGAPKEAPYIQENNEFEDVQNEVIEVESVTAPAAVESVTPSSPKKSMVRKSSKEGVEYIQHPQAKKGLIKIDSDGTYIYRTSDAKDEHDTSATVRIGMMDPPAIESEITNFKVMYSEDSVPIVMFDYEWQPFSGYGKLGVIGGLGIMTAQGQGRFFDGSEAEEQYTFYALPLSLGVIYRLEWMSGQWFAPYVSGAGTYIGIVEMRDDNESPKILGVPGAYGAGGMLFNITAMDRETAFNLRSEYGIKNLWVTAEYRHLQTFNDAMDFSSGIISLGISADY